MTLPLADETEALPDTLRRRIHLALDSSVASDFLTVSLHRLLVLLVAASVSAVVLESVPAYAAQYGQWFMVIEKVAVAVFTLEYVLRIWTAPEHTPFSEMHPWAARWNFAISASAIVDLLSIAPFFLTIFIPGDLKVLLLFRLLRFFKLARYSAGMRSLVAALEAERKALLASATVLFGLVLVAASAIHLVEHQAQPDKFGSIPDSMWWAIVTLTTVGYGDVVPITVAGRIVAGFTMLMGLMMLALPIGIVANAFAEEIHRREFVVTWGMLARVPLFASLDAGEIAEVMRYLRAQTIPPDTLIVRKGEEAHSMYFVAVGSVEVEAAGGPIRLGEGTFFGEMALLRRAPRNANVRSVQATKLLILDGVDLRSLMERNPEIRRRIEAVVSERS